MRHAMIGLGMALYAMACSPALAAGEVVGVEHWVENADTRIYVWEKFTDKPTGKKIVVLAHGSATAGKESFDLQVPGKPSYSLMDRLAREGFDVFALDTRGFGRSTRPDKHMTTGQAKEDLKAAIDHILKLRGASKVSLVAWSWGTQYGGMYVMDNPGTVDKYVTYAQMHVDSPDVARRRARIDAFRENAYITIPEPGWKPRFTSMTPAEVNESDVVSTFATIAAKVETKSPTGPQLDLATALPMVNPRLIPVPTMVIHGQYDDVADTDGLLPFFASLPNPQKKYVVIPNAGHMMHLQKGHQLFQHEVVGFLKDPAS
ncbi:alpha/beta hydrolase [Azospirillum ramasamyi]|nr:alpha/beta fold hydrolase [Azospirillum ramasamyi]